ncbi:hypothetical protein AKO1_012316 [Acrasis kona]|uniref:Uncharacterized protein n=1 Tax=Acrasis kona TaxID=1008807 RepID=A0AAW2YVQ5_9EUKA
MYCINQPESLPTIGNKLEMRIRGDLMKRNYNFVIIGCKTLDQIFNTCIESLSLFIINFVNVIKTLLDDTQQDYRLKIMATEMLTRGFSSYQDQPSPHFLPLTNKLNELMNRRTNNVQEDLAVRLAAIRTASSIVNVVDLQNVEGLQAILLSLLVNIKPLFPEDQVRADVELVDVRQSSSSSIDHVAMLQREVDAPLNLLLPASLPLITVQHVGYTAIDALRSIARKNTTATSKTVINSILNFFDSQSWNPYDMVKFIFRVLIQFGEAQQGYATVLQLITHSEKVVEHKAAAIRTASFILSIQTRKAAVGPKAYETISALVKLLLAETDPYMHEVTLEAISTIAKSGQRTNQNIEIMNGMLFSQGKRRDINEQVLFRALLAVASCAVYVPPGKTYHEPFMKMLCEECCNPTRSPNIRVILLQILKKICKTQKRIVGLDNDQQPAVTSNSVANSNPLGSSNAAMVPASLSRKQREEVYFCLFKTAQLKDNEPANFTGIYRTLNTLLKQHRNKDLDITVPLIMSLQESCNKDLDAVHCSPVQSLVAAYLLLLAKAYNSGELLRYVTTVIESRQQSSQIHPDFIDSLSQINNVPHHASASAIGVDSIQLTIDGTSGALPVASVDPRTIKQQRGLVYQKVNDLFVMFSPVDQQNLFNIGQLVDVLSRIESLKQSYENIIETMSKPYTGEPISVSATQNKLASSYVVNDDEPQWNSMVDEESEPSIHENDKIADLEVVPIVNIDVVSADFTRMGDSAVANSSKSHKALSDILNLVPDGVNKTGSDVIDDEATLASELDDEGEEETAIGMPQQKKSKVLRDVPKLYLFDEPAYI